MYVLTRSRSLHMRKLRPEAVRYFYKYHPQSYLSSQSQSTSPENNSFETHHLCSLLPCLTMGSRPALPAPIWRSRSSTSTCTCTTTAAGQTPTPRRPCTASTITASARSPSTTGPYSTAPARAPRPSRGARASTSTLPRPTMPARALFLASAIPPSPSSLTMKGASRLLAHHCLFWVQNWWKCHVIDMCYVFLKWVSGLHALCHGRCCDGTWVGRCWWNGRVHHGRRDCEEEPEGD